MNPPETLEDRWRTAAADLSLDIQIPFELDLLSGERVIARVLLKNFGAEKGMLIVSDYDAISDVWQQIIDQGWLANNRQPFIGKEWKRTIEEIMERAHRRLR